MVRNDTIRYDTIEEFNGHKRVKLLVLEIHGCYRLKNKNKILQIKSQKNIVVVVVVKLNQRSQYSSAHKTITPFLPD